MKKWFTCITSILYVLFFCFILKASPDSMLFSMYPDVLVRSIPQEVDLAQLQAALDDLGKETDSLIALRVAQPSNDQGKTSRFTYILFGSGRLPDGFAEADEQDRKLVNLAATYSILDGALSQQRLAAALQSVGAEVVFFPGESSPLTLSLGYLPRPSLSFSLILFGLLFIVLISMRRIKELRASGIQVLSGMDRSRLFKRFLLDDFLSILLGFLAAALTSAGFLCLMKLWNPRFFIFLLTAAGLYALILLALALLMEFLFRRILRKSKLIELIKGKMPLRSVLAVLMAGQFIAFLGVGFGSHMVSVVFPLYQTMTQGMQAWAERPDAFHFMYNLGSFDAKQRERQNQRSFAWYDFAREALQDPDVLYCEHFLREMDPILPTVEESRKLLLVSPSFLKKEGLLSDPQEQARMENLKEGEFGLILPAGLSDTQRADTEQALRERLFSDYWGEDASCSPEDIRLLPLTSAKREPVFTYNYEGKPPAQYSEDPYIVVLSPQATGASLQAARFWASGISAYLLFPSYERLEGLLDQHGLTSLVSHIRNVQAVYLEEVENYRNETFALIVGGVIGTLTAAATFIVMNRLYFEHFRREIFIRRISGMPFLKNHRDYLRIQGGLLVAGCVLLLLLSRKPLLSFSVLLVFMGLEGVLLYRQMKMENKSAVTLLKGK